MPWERFGTLGTSCYVPLNPLQSCRAVELRERGLSWTVGVWVLAIGASGRERMVLERAGWAFLTWAHGGVVTGSLLTQWPAALRAV